MANKTLKEIAIEYANKFGGGLPLSPEELLNAVVLWVQNYVAGSDGGGGVNVDILSTLIEGSDTVVVDINEENTALEIHADYENIVQPLARAIKTPLANPNVEKIPVLQPNGEVVYRPKMYKHILISHPSGAPEDVGYTLVVYSTVNGSASMLESDIKELVKTANSAYYYYGMLTNPPLSSGTYAWFTPDGILYYEKSDNSHYVVRYFFDGDVVSHTVEEL